MPLINRGPRQAVLIAAGTGLVVSLGLAVVLFPVAVLALPVLIILAILLSSSLGRLCFVVVGGVVVLQSSSAFDGPKLTYLVGMACCFVGALANLWQNRVTDSATLLRRLLVANALFLVMVLMSAIVARAHGIPAVLWVRDAASFVLVASIPLFALDARAAGERPVTAVLVLVGVLAAASFCIEWLGRRNLVDAALPHLFLPSGALASALFAYAASRLLASPTRHTLSLAMWAVLLGFIAGAMWVTATRSALIIVVAPAVILILGPRSALGLRTRRAALFAPIVSALTLLFAVAIADIANVDLSRAVGRLGSITSPIDAISEELSGPSPVSAPSASQFRTSSPRGTSTQPPRGGSLPVSVVTPAAGRTTTSSAQPQRSNEPSGAIFSLPTTVPAAVAAQTFTERAIQTRLAWDDFIANPFFGTGPGRVYVWNNQFGRPLSTLSLDTPLSLLAKFGLVGVVTVLVVALALGEYVRRILAASGWTPNLSALIAYLSIWVAYLPLGLPFTDKGFSFGLLLLLALTIPSLTSETPVNHRPVKQSS